MDDAFLATLRCPVDPAREATLRREASNLVCSGCAMRFPVKNGLPVLIPDEAELPPHMKELTDRSRLPCVRAAGRAN